MLTVLLTGGTTRLGSILAEGLRAAGHRVVTTSHRTDAGADIVADLTQPHAAARLYAQALQLLGGQPPDVLVNNAALYTGEDAAVTACNLTAPTELTILMAGRETGCGSVINILDSAPPLDTAYGESKRGLRAKTRDQACLFAETLRVNGVALGPVLPPVSCHVKAPETLLGRPSPEDVVRAVLYLISAKSTTGSVLDVDGGLHLL